MCGPATKSEQYNLVKSKQNTLAPSQTDEFLVAYSREVLQYSDYSDIIIPRAGETGWNWRVQEAVNRAELEHSCLVVSMEVVWWHGGEGGSKSLLQ